MRPLLEVCVDSIESARAAITGSADRLEVCSSLALGGLTPSCGLLMSIRSISSETPLYAMIRPRAGDFCYTEREITQMKFEIEMIKRNNLADGFVFGVLLYEGTVDVENCKTLLELCNPLPTTFHRAFDVCRCPLVALEEIIQLGFTRILSSGQTENALLGRKLLRDLVKLAKDRIIIMPGCGINVRNLDMILDVINPKEFHSSASVQVFSDMSYRKSSIKFDKNPSAQQNSCEDEPDDIYWYECDSSKVKSMIDIAKEYSRNVPSPDTQ
ncbi:Copper homeostasis protein cutC -like protein [Halotydeus destructor]|nr:Copper homeostasis protein cutC -like protein [Halotydeus destructor]